MQEFDAMGYKSTFGGRAGSVIPFVLLAAALLLLITACSRPGQPSGQNQVQQQQARALAYARCMRAHGVPNYPDPTFTSNGVTNHSPQGVDPNSPTYKAAEQDCAKYRPGPGSQSPQQEAQAKQDGTKLAQCMHSHGFPDFPEPNNQGVIVINPSDGIDTNSSKYQNAFNHCAKGNIEIQQISGSGNNGPGANNG